MFQKILIVESLDSILLGLVTSLQNHFQAEIDTAKDGDGGMLKIKSQLTQNKAYDLIITSLNYAPQKSHSIKMGENFISAARSILPGIKVMVYSDSIHSFRIHKLFHEHKINAYVGHGPNSMPEVIDAIKMLYKSEVEFISPKILPFNQTAPDVELNDFDIELLRQLAKGKSQPEISDFFMKKGIHASISTIEKHISRLRLQFDAVNTTNLVVLAKDTGII
jgi:DNA-binding NarL/FixJ family response regulator